MKIIAPGEPQEYTIKIVKDDQEQYEYKVDDNGKVMFLFPTLPRYCDVFLFGFIKIKDRDPYKRKVIYVMKKESSIRKLSFYEIAKLPKDEEGFSLFRLNN